MKSVVSPFKTGIMHIMQDWPALRCSPSIFPCSAASVEWIDSWIIPGE